MTAVALHGLAYGLRQTARAFGGQKVCFQQVGIRTRPAIPSGRIQMH